MSRDEHRSDGGQASGTPCRAAAPTGGGLRLAGVAAALFAFVLGARWAFGYRFGTDLPEWDQWDAEGAHLLSPWLSGRFTLGELFHPHNEHRVVLTKLLNLGLALANGQWDQRVECVVNALLPAGIAVGLFAVACRGLRGRWIAPLVALLLAGYGLPLASDNIVSGFHSQQFFLIGLSFAAIALLPGSRPGSAGWWLGSVSAVLAMGSQASGFLASAVVIGLVALRVFRREVTVKAALPPLALCGLLVAAGCLTRVRVDYHEALQAHTIPDFAMTALRAAAWPMPGVPWLGLVLWLPWCLVVLRLAARDRPGARGLDLTLGGLGGWVLLQILATAYSRGAGAPGPASRYVDTLVLGAVVNALSVARLLDCLKPGGRLRWAAALAAAAWMALLGTGVIREGRRTFSSETPALKTYHLYCVQNVRNFLATGDEAFLHHEEIPYPDAAAFLKLVNLPGLRSVLPASVRPALPLAASALRGPFAEHDARMRQDAWTFNELHGAPTPASWGLSPATPVLLGRVTWGSFGQRAAPGGREWRSVPIRASLRGWLKIEVAGHLGEPGADLELRDAADGRLLASVRPDKVPGESWRPAYVRTPAAPFVVVARSAGPENWFAFSQPTEMGPLSHGALLCQQAGLDLAGIAAAALLLLAGFSLSLGEVRRRVSRAAAKLSVLDPFLAAALFSAVATIPFIPAGPNPAGGWAWRAGAVFVGIAAAFGLIRAVRADLGPARLIRLLSGRPLAGIAAVAAAAVAASAYPVLFQGKSYVAPNLGTALLYDSLPTLPGYADSAETDPKGSDVGAIMWQSVPYSVLQQKSVFRDFALPVWNRYNSCGTLLLAQGQSMFGDPLQLLVMAARGASWAWDLKFLLAKWLFALGTGLLVLAAARHLPSAWIVTLAAPFAGFFVYRINHPAFFSFCYAPWPLYCWLRYAGAGSRRAAAGWLGGLVLANLALMNSGTVKEAYMLLLTMNLAGAAVLLASRAPGRVRLAKAAGAAAAGLLFALLTAPVWWSFLDALKSAYTGYNAPSAFQIQPSLLLGTFDELFFRPLSEGGHVFNPALNFLLLAGLLYFLASLRAQFANRTAVALAASSLVPLSLAYGLVPPPWITATPFLGNVAHLDNSFSCGLIVLWSVLAGVGFAAAARRLGTPEGRSDLVIAGLLLFWLVFNFVAYRQAVHRAAWGPGTTFSALKPGEVIAVAPFIWWQLAGLLAALIALGAVARRALSTGRLSPAAGWVLAACAVVFLWREGLQPGTSRFADYVARPAERVDFGARSEAVAFVQAGQAREPARSVGVEGNLFPGWTGMYGIEGICGPDALMNPYYRELTGVSPVRRIWDWRLYLTADKVAAARPFLDFLNVRYYLASRGDTRESGAGLKLGCAADLGVFESPTAWPRAFFSDRLMVYDRPEELMGRILRGDGRPFAAAQAADLPAAPGLGSLAGDLQARAVVPATGYRLLENATEFDIRAPGPGVVVLGEANWDGYPHAEVDGRTVRVLRLNHAFEGVEIGAAGSHHLVFTYRPRGFGLTVGLSLAALAAIGMALAAATLRREAVPSSTGTAGQPS